jgi:hypothetical protein
MAAMAALQAGVSVRGHQARHHVAEAGGGQGPEYRLVPGSRVKIFHVTELDRWISETPPPPMTEAERGRLEKLQAGGKRGREKMRARRQAEVNELEPA